MVPLNPIITDDSRPDELGVYVELQSEADFGAALRELYWIQTRAETVDAAAAQKIALVKSMAEDDKAITFGPVKVTFADRRALLEAACREFAEAHRDIILPDGPKSKKSREFTHATVGWRKGADSLMDLEGLSADDVIAKIEKLAGAEKSILAKVLGWLQKLKIGSRRLDTLLTVKIAPDRTAIKQAIAKEEITLGDVKRMGMELVEGSDEFYIKPTRYTVASEHTAAV